jgi:hypothetical protein
MPSKVIRIDEEVWAELQRRARLLEDTPNSVVRRVFGLPEGPSEDQEAETDLRLDRLIELVEAAAGQRPPLSPTAKGYAVLAETHESIAFIRVQRDRLRVTASKQAAEAAGLSAWHRERSDTDFRGGSVSWFALDSDEVTYQEAALVLVELLLKQSPS